MLDVLHSPKVRKKFNFFSLFYILDQTCFSHLRRKAKTHLCSSASKLESQWGSLLSLAWLPVLPTHSGAGRSSQSIGLLCLRKGEMLTRLHSQMNNYIYIVICRCRFFLVFFFYGGLVLKWNMFVIQPCIDILFVYVCVFQGARSVFIFRSVVSWCVREWRSRAGFCRGGKRRAGHDR